MWHYKITLQYNGTGFCGWQKQLHCPMSSIQGLLELALYKLVGQEITAYGAGRTDAGVHAIGQVVSFTLPKYFGSQTVCKAINFHLTTSKIVVYKAELTTEDFHARFSATKRTYLYRIFQSKYYSPFNKNLTWLVPNALNIEKMKKAANFLIGFHDFNAFRATGCQAKSSCRTISSIEIFPVNLFPFPEIHLYVSAPSFLHNQVRIIVGTLVDVGLGKIIPSEIKTILESKSRVLAGTTAPACGLFLYQIDY